MPSFDDWFPSTYFKAEDVIDNPMILTIAAIKPEKMQDGKQKPVVYFKEDKRGLVLNVTNKNFLVLLMRSKNPADAIGLRVMLVAVEAEYQGKPCMALRLRRPPESDEQQPKSPKLDPAKRRPRGKAVDEESDDEAA